MDSRPDPYELAQVLSDVARRLEAEPDMQHTLTAVVRAVVDTIDGAERAGILELHGRERITSTSPSDDVVRKLDQLEAEHRQGPCVDALWDRHTVTIPDMCSEERWPEFSSRAAELGVRSMLSFQLWVQGNNLGALDLFSSVPHAFTEGDVLLGQAFAAHAAIAWAGAVQEHHLNEALGTRDVIGQAKGILMVRNNLSSEQAFEMLIRASQDVNLKLVEVARWLVDEFDHPESRRRPHRQSTGGT